MKDENSKSKIFICSDRVGYGHIRGMLAMFDALELDGIPADVGFVSEFSNLDYRKYWKWIDSLFGLSYKFLAPITSRFSAKDSLTTMSLINLEMAKVDKGSFAGYLKHHKYELVIASHITGAYLVKDLPVIVLGLDPFAGLYFCDQPNVITSAVDKDTADQLLELGAKDVRVVGPILAAPVIKARPKAAARIAEVRKGMPLRIAIATGGSLTHGDQITALAKEIAAKTTSAQIEKIWIVAGDSKTIHDETLKAIGSDDRFEIIYNKDVLKLVRAVDEAVAQADIVIAKTGELAFTVAGGKAFKTFFANPSLGPQEIAIRKYVQETSLKNNISALEFGIDPAKEIERILIQHKDGTLAQMMENGMQLPVNGVHLVAKLALQMLEHKA